LVAATLVFVLAVFFIYLKHTQSDPVIKQKHFKYSLCNQLKLNTAAIYNLISLNLLEDKICNFFSTDGPISYSESAAKFIFHRIETAYSYLSRFIEDNFYE
jgi:hypothetical protein